MSNEDPGVNQSNTAILLNGIIGTTSPEALIPIDCVHPVDTALVRFSLVNLNQATSDIPESISSFVRGVFVPIPTLHDPPPVRPDP